GPRDLAAIRDGLAAGLDLARLLDAATDLGGLPPALAAARDACASADRLLASSLAAALATDLPLFARDGGLVCAGYHAELDEQRKLRDDTRQVIAGLQAQYAGATNVKSLK